MNFRGAVFEKTVPRTLLRYAVAVAFTVGSLALRMLLGPALGTTVPYITSFPAVILSAWFGGLGPGLLSTLLSGLIAQYFLVEPVGSLRITTLTDVAGLTVFFGVGAVLSWLIHELRKSQQEAHRAKEEAEREREHLRSLFMQAPAIINIQRGPKHVFEFVHPLTSKLLGGRQVDGLPAREAIPDLASQGFVDLLDEAYSTGKPVIRNEMPGTLAMPDGTVKDAYFNLTYNPWRDADGTVAGVMTFALEVTDQVNARKRMQANEQHMRETAKLESLGVLAGGIAHDFNNLLVAIMGNASLAIEILPPDHPTRPLLNEVVDASARAANLTRQMLAYSGKGRFVVERIDLSATVRGISSLLTTSIPRTVELHLDLASDLPPIEVDTAQMQQLLMNLAINGAEACEGKPGRVTITTARQQVDEHYLQSMALGEIEPGTYVSLEVQDNGCGMDEATQSKIFDPFFTTKFTGRGLGLAAALGIIRGHRAAIKIYSAPGEGSTFRVLFPAAQGSATAPVRGRNDDLTGTGTILVMDDEEIVRRTTRTALARYGYTTLVAEDGEAGVEIFAHQPADIDLVILDMTMPAMSGEDAFQQLKKIRPDIPVILSSGFNSVEAIRRFSGQGLAGFLQKPYTAAQLGEQVKSVLQGRRVSP